MHLYYAKLCKIFLQNTDDALFDEEKGKIYARRKIDVETAFGKMKTCLGCTRYTVRGIEKVRKQSGILMMALNMMKLATLSRNNEHYT